MSQTGAETRRIPQPSPQTTRDPARPVRQRYPLIASPWHTLLVLALQGFVAYRGMAHAIDANLDRIALYERTILSEWLVLALVLIGVWRHGSSLHSVLGERWGSWRRFFRDLGIGVIFLIIAIIVGSVLSQGIEHSSARAILPHTRTELLLWIALSLTAGICEEALYRGYLQRQFITMTRNVPAGILFSAALFGMSHLYQGVGQALQIAVLGAMSGVLAFWCKSVRPGMIAHVLQDVLGGLHSA